MKNKKRQQTQKTQKKDWLLITSLYLLIGSLTCVAVYFAITITRNSTQLESSSNMKNVEVKKKWMNYVNSEYGFSLEVPRLLTKRESKNQNGYEYLLILGQNKMSTGKGVAIGVSTRPLEEEITWIKEGYLKDESAELINESSIEVKGEKGKRLSYKSKSEEDSLEPREIIIVKRGVYTYTISTHPEQIEYITNSFKFI